MSDSNNTVLSWMLIDWILFFVFALLSILNFIFVHFTPGLFYGLLSLFYFPIFTAYIESTLDFKIPLLIKIPFAFLVLWGTLAVGDLFELFEDWMGY